MLSDEAMAGVVDDYDYWHLPKLLLAPPDWYVTALINVRMHLISQYFHGYRLVHTLAVLFPTR